MRYASIRTQRRKIGKLSDAPSAQADKTPKARQVVNFSEATYVALNIGFKVIAESLQGFKPLIMNPRIESRVEYFVYRITGSRPPAFCLEKTVADEAKLFVPPEID